MSEQLTLGIDASPATVVRTRAPKTVVPHAEARRVGLDDGRAGVLTPQEAARLQYLRRKRAMVVGEAG